ncbi:MAG: NAD(P)H-dependent glycerol-3-phosphate dehydrogenase [Myxococcales bacterium]|nr:NAD(P)-dependent glycerol-3-phosphate dehydrogenase [Myxococcota bacterium]MDW8282207.1 NAD(P)H-dependent glycerol-3-phosphate dehydrogenase [Myxococcales bacterium]
MDIVVVGAGSWGTALASVLCHHGHRVTLWGRDAALLADIERTGENRRYLPGLRLPPGLRTNPSLADALRSLPRQGPGQAMIVAVVPSQTLRHVMSQVATEVPQEAIVVSAAKGIENETLLTMEQVLRQVLPPAPVERLAVLSGPSFARETVEGQPTAVVVASRSPEVAQTVQQAFQMTTFRVYTSTDVIGVEIGGAVKNVIAIACGMAEGLGLGHNARAALITRGLAEMSRLGVRLSANPLTLAGLAGLGDLVLTCTGGASRNRSVGLQLGQGRALGEVMAGMTQVAEGVRTTRSLRDLAVRLGVEMPISQAMYQVLYEDRPVRQVLVDLLGRPPRAELG